MHRKLFVSALFIAITSITSAGSAQNPSIEGTYRLMARTLKDGTVIRPPEIQRIQTYTREYRQFNIVSKDDRGNMVSRSIIATYSLTPNEYIETPLFHILVRGNEVRDLSSAQPQRSAVTVEGARVTLAAREREQRVTVYEGNKFTATSAMNTDSWEKVD